MTELKNISDQVSMTQLEAFFTPNDRQAPPIETTVAIEAITLDRELQFRTFTDAGYIKDLESSFKDNGQFNKKIELNRLVDSSTTTYWVKDGTHRLLAAKAAGATHIEAIVREVNSREEAMFSAMGVNVLHGKAATIDDLKLVMEALRTSSLAPSFKRKSNPFMWDMEKLRVIFKCSRSKLEKVVQDTAALMRTELNWKIRGLWEQGIRNCDIARELGIPYGSAETIVNKLKKEAQEREEATAMSDLPTSEEKAQTSNSVTPSNGELIIEDFVLNDSEEEDTGLPIDIQALTASFNRKSEATVVKVKATPVVCMVEAKAMIQSMTPMQQTELYQFLQNLTLKEAA